MKKVGITTGILAVAFVALSATSCKDNKKENNDGDGHHSEQIGESGHMEGQMGDHSNMDHGNMESSDKMTDKNENTMMSSQIIGNYLQLKNALVEDNNEAAKKAGAQLLASLGKFDVSSYTSEQQKELKDIIEDAMENAEHISESPIHHQREHFETLSQDVLDFVAVTGTSQTLYKDFCPMHNDNKGSMWLSETKEIKNPYFGSKMLSCGSVQKEIR